MVCFHIGNLLATGDVADLLQTTSLDGNLARDSIYASCPEQDYTLRQSYPEPSGDPLAASIAPVNWNAGDSSAAHLVLGA